MIGNLYELISTGMRAFLWCPVTSDVSLREDVTVDEDIETIMRKYEGQLMQMPNVQGVGIGEEGGNPVVKVFVTRKVPESELQSQEIVPRDLEGYKTDVEEIGVITTQ